MRANLESVRNHGTILTLSVFLVLCGVAISSICGAQTVAPGETLTLKKVVEVALKNQPAIDAQAGQVASGEAKLGQARGSYYPRANISGAYTRISPVTSQTALTTSSSGLPPGSFVPTGVTGQSYEQYAAVGSLSQLLFDFGRTGAQVDSQKLSTQAARYDLANTREQVVFDVKQAYYGLLGTGRAMKVATESVEQFKKHLVQARAL
jgi:outer membrane protein